MKLFMLAGGRATFFASALLLITGTNSGHAQATNTNFQVTITTPANDTAFIAPTNIQINAETYDTNNDLAYVTFVASPPWGEGPSLLLGTVSNPAPTVPPGSYRELFILNWTNVPIGTWLLTASAFRTNGTAVQEADSPPVTITVRPSGALYVDLASPTNGAVFPEPTDIQLIAGVIDTNGYAVQVEFFDGLTSLGIASNGAVVDPPGSPGLPPGSRAYFLTWSNAPVGIHSLTAVVTDTNGQLAVSVPVEITVTSSYHSAFSVAITAPTNGSTFTAPTNIQISAVTYDTNDDVGGVGFVAVPAGPGARPNFVLQLGNVSNGVPVGGPGSHQELFTWTWTNALIGIWELRASALRTNGTMPQVVDAPPVIFTNKRGGAISVDIASPGNGATFLAPTNIQLIAGVIDTNGAGVQVEFFDGFTSLGMVTNGVVVDPPGSPGLPPGSRAYFLTWSNPPVGLHVVFAAVKDTAKQSAFSYPVVIFVSSNSMPVARITCPPNNSVFRAPVNIALLAYANAPGAAVSSLQFFNGSNSLGFGAPILMPTNLPDWPPILPGTTFELTLSNPPPASYTVTAVADFSTGDATTSAPVNITVVSQPPPPTNGPEVVNIVATDPLAIEGTNCWTWPGLPVTNAAPTWSNWMSPTAPWFWFTNCGPKDATFAIRRCGEISNEITVNYTIAGTASNGVDFAALPGAVQIPAGQTEAMITVIPINEETNGEPGMAPATVILSLNPPTNNAADYTVGFPPSAEALIIDSEAPHPLLTGTRLADHSFYLSMNGPDGAWFRIDDSADCLNWRPVCTNQVVNGFVNFADPSAGRSSARWYRAVPVANLPSN